MAREKPPKRLIFQWITLKGLTAILLFLVVAALIEYIIVLHTVSLGVKDETLLQCNLRFPGTDWIISIAISPLFHLTPIAAIIALASSWAYLTKHVAVKSRKWKGKVKPVARRRRKSGFKEVNKLASKIRSFFRRIRSGLLRIEGVSYLWEKIHFARATVRSALTVLLAFGTVALLVSCLAYPRLIYSTVSNVYQNNASLLGFAKSVSNFGRYIAVALTPIGWICSAVDNALLSFAPRFRDFIVSVGSLTKPLVELDDAGKYLVFQNVPVWVSALTALAYGGYRSKGYRYKRGRRP